MIRKVFFISIVLLLSKAVAAQYDTECFVTTKEALLNKMNNSPIDSVFIDDSVDVSGHKQYKEKKVGIRFVGLEPSELNKFVGCKMPDFSFFNISGEDFSVYKTKTEFTILNFTMDCGDVCDFQTEEFSHLKTKLKDSVTVYNIYEERKNKVEEYAKNMKFDNVEYIANADMLFYSYTVGQSRPILYLLDRHKNIIYVKVGQNQTESRTYLYNLLLEKMRSTNCSD